MKKYDSEKENVYDFMKSVSRHLDDDPYIISLISSRGVYSIKIVTSEENSQIYSLYGGDEFGEVFLDEPFVTGRLEDILIYLNSRQNIDEIIMASRLCNKKSEK